MLVAHDDPGQAVMIDSVGRTTVHEHPPAMLLRRAVARGVDSALSAVLSAAIVWPLAWGAASEALTSAGFGSFLDFLEAGPASTAQAGGAVDAAVQQLQPVVVSALLLQLGIVWLYEVAFLSLTGSTPGKGLFRLRVVRHHTPVAVLSPLHREAGPSRAGRLARMALRSALVVGPPALAATMLVAAWLDAPGATDLAEVTIALTLVLGVLWLAGGMGAHGFLSRTAVVPFSWAQARAAGEQYLRAEAADPARQRQMTHLTARAERVGERAAERAKGTGERAAERAKESSERAAERARGSSELAAGRTQGLLQGHGEPGGLRGLVAQWLESTGLGERLAEAMREGASTSPRRSTERDDSERHG